eukprot:CAMPEP_0170556344 /NCGR_PEP_ID=MMETSP0211-20121228/16360_1 /TAXON_ID=311385 /ORGANISM="Pseudokeronopsis sp., Strain OXSARD2" /LENGTH=40 /DNA_ID= /DNA_START= /DNA_END= /DNA_ORIENTATION=
MPPGMQAGIPVAQYGYPPNQYQYPPQAYPPNYSQDQFQQF